MKEILYLIIYLSFASSYSQKQIYELEKQIAIPFVEIYSDEGDLIDVTNEEGYISRNFEAKINFLNTRNVIFVHPFFENKQISIEEYFNSKIINLKRNVIELKEVVISKRRGIKYLKLKGYFRSVQMNDNKPHYFNDGIVNYYIPLRTGKIKTKVLFNRSFEDKSLKQLSGLYHFSVVGVPLFNDLLIHKNILNKYSLNKESDKSESIMSDNKTKGYINTSNNNLELQLSINSKEDSKKMKLLGMESELDLYNISAIYDSSDKIDFDLTNLIFFKEIRGYNLRKNKRQNFSKIDAIHEFFILEKEYIENIDDNDFNNNYSFIYPSRYYYPFWIKVDNRLFQPYPTTLSKAIQQMTEIK
ncbi:MAG: hypothetical protein KA210_04820 [Bacteroidia bacterium]|nr:hypothetical protein [Bacteroidia bacterium]